MTMSLAVAVSVAPVVLNFATVCRRPARALLSYNPCIQHVYPVIARAVGTSIPAQVISRHGDQVGICVGVT